MSDSTPPLLPAATQKLVTIYLDNTRYADGKFIVGSYADQHGVVEEHLGPFLEQGWRVRQMEGFGGGSDGLAVRGWVVVLLERAAS